MRRTRLFSILAMFSLMLCAQLALAQDAYQRGYDFGYRMGQQDQQAGRASDYTRSTTYREAIEGWTGQGDRAQYRTDFRFGFREGYQDGYRQAPRGSRSGTSNYPSSTTSSSTVANASELPADLRPHMQAAFNNGYYTGYSHGQRDAGRQYNAKHDVEYQRALHGYDANQHGNDVEGYKRDFRAGYLVGFDDAYNRRNQDVNAAWQRASSEGISYLPSVGASQPVGSYDTGQGRGNANANTQDQAYVNGYRLGYDEGRQETGQQYRPQDSRVWREGISGYNARRYSSAQEYRQMFRQGFEAGYDDGYNGRTAQVSVNAPRGFGQRVYGQTAGVSGNSIFVPAGTTLRLRVNNTISTRTNHEGDRFTATVTEPVYAQGGEVAIPSGSTVTGVITKVERAGRIGGNSELQLRYETITLPGGNEYQVQASTENVAQGGNARVDQEGQVEGKSSTTRDVGTVAAGAALGAIIGAIAGGGKGAGVGAAVGSAVGLGAILTTRGRDVDIPSGSPMEIRLQNGLELRRTGTSTGYYR